MTTFAIIGAGGYIAQRHMDAIKAVGGELVCACDINDSVGILDKYGDVKFFQSEHLFFPYLQEHPVDYTVICTPNYCHYDHIRLALYSGSKVICEKPLTISYKQACRLRGLADVFCVLQLRYHPMLLAIKDKLLNARSVGVFYTVKRGDWYNRSWKADPELSGGLAMNIGVHIFDYLTWVLGRPHRVTSEWGNDGWIYYENKDIYFSLFISRDSNRIIKIDDEEFNFNDGFTDLHTKVYEEILDGRGFHTSDVLEGIRLVEAINGNICTQ